MDKPCGFCKETKPLNEFFTAPFDSRAAELKTSEFCKQCHREGNIKYGYGWYGDKYKSPDSM